MSTNYTGAAAVIDAAFKLADDERGGDLLLVVNGHTVGRIVDDGTDGDPSIVIYDRDGEPVFTDNLIDLGVVIEAVCTHGCGEPIFRTFTGWSHSPGDDTVVYCFDQDEPGNPSCRAEPLPKGPAPYSDGELLDAIATVLDGTEWSADTAAAIADVVRLGGRQVRDTDDVRVTTTRCRNCGQPISCEEPNGVYSHDDLDNLSTWCNPGASDAFAQPPDACVNCGGQVVREGGEWVHVAPLDDLTTLCPPDAGGVRQVGEGRDAR